MHAGPTADRLAAHAGPLSVPRVAKASEPDRYLLMVAASPNRLPARGADGRVDLMSERVIEQACWGWLAKGARTGLLHKRGKTGEEPPFRVVESYVYRNRKPWRLRAPDGTVVTIRQGDWLVGGIARPDVFEAVLAGELNGASVQGSMLRRPVSQTTLKRQRAE